jgi:hypothetical protein
MTFDKLGFIDVMQGHKSLLTAEWLWLKAIKCKIINCTDFAEAATLASLFKMFIPLNNGVVVRDWALNPYEHSNKDMQDNAIAVASMDVTLAKQIAWHGLTHFGHYDNISFKENKRIYGGFWQAVYQHIQRTRQPMHMAMFCLQAYGICEPIGLIQLILAILFEPFREGTSSKKLFFLFFMSARGLGVPLCWLAKKYFNFMMLPSWVEDTYQKYYHKTCPELAELAKNVKI